MAIVYCVWGKVAIVYGVWGKVAIVYGVKSYKFFDLVKGGPGKNLSLKPCVVGKSSFSKTCSEHEDSAYQVQNFISARYLP